MRTTKKTGARPALTKPAPLRAGHLITEFKSTEDVLNNWLIKRALPAMAARTANTFVVCRGRRVVAYYSLATGSIAHAESSSDLRRNTPDPVPAIILARLAVSADEENQGIGRHLVQDAMKRTLAAAKYVAARTLIVHALNDKVAGFYRKLGFLDLPVREGARTLHLKLETIAASLKQPR